MKSHKLVVLEGIDGVGKTTLAHLLVEHLSRDGISAICYEDVEDKYSVFNEVKTRVKDLATIEAQFYFYLASAIQKSKHIDRLLQKQWVVCDRYVYSTYAYHIAKGMNIEHMPSLEILPVHTPDVALLLILDEQIRQERVRQRGSNDMHDYELKKPESFLGRFETELKKFNLVELNTSDSILDTVREIICRTKAE